MKEYNCPDCDRTDSCIDCSRVKTKEDLIKVLHIPEYFPDSIIWPQEQFIPSCCKNCGNHPVNGGSGVCHCILPSISTNSPYTVTYTAYE